MSDEQRRSDQDSRISSQQLRAATLEGVRWITYGRIASEITAFATLVVLAHLISPTEYGHVATALILQAVAFGLTNEAFGNPLVQRERINQMHVRTSWLASLLFGCGMAVLVFVAAPIVVEPLLGTADLVQLACLLFPAYAVTVVPTALLYRRLQFRTLSVIDAISLLAGSAVSIILAVAGVEGEAVVLGVLTSACVSAALLLTQVAVPWPGFARREAREILSFGVPASLSGAVYLSVQNIDYILIGSRLGPTALGYYYRAFSLGVANQLKIGTVLMRLALPVYSRASSQQERLALRDRMTRVNSAVIVPLLVILAIVAPELVPALFGEQWRAAVVPTQILTVGGIAASLTHCATPYLLAAGRPTSVVTINLVTLAALGGGIALAVPSGLNAVCWAVAGANGLTLVVAYVVQSRLTEMPFRRLWDDLAGPLGACSGLAAVGVPLMALCAAWPTFAQIALVGACSGVSYLVTLRLLSRACFDDLTLLVRGVLGRARSAGAPDVDESAASAAEVRTAATPVG